MMTVSSDGSVIDFFEPEAGFSDGGITALCLECGVEDVLNGCRDGYGRIVAVARNDGGISGYACALYVGDSADIGSICVAEPFRRRHIADVMLGGIIELLLKKKIVKVWLEVRESNAAARALYSAHGFREAGTVRSYYRAPTENAVRMALDLGENEDTLV